MTGEIDLTDWIREAHQFEHFQDGTAYLIEKHGGGTNDSGVFRDGEMIELATIGRSRAKAKIARTAGGAWLHGADTANAIGGMGSPISVWSRTGYATREDAIDAARRECREYFKRETVSTNSCLTDGMRTEAFKMVEALSPKEPAAQMSLFELLATPAVPSRSTLEP